MSVQGSFTDVENAAVTEASYAGDLYRTLNGLSDTGRVRIQHDVVTYLDLVIDQEWPATKRGQASDTTWRQADGLYADITPEDARPEVIVDELIWQPISARTSFVLDVPAFFTEIIGR